jgi:hypothetical protein
MKELEVRAEALARTFKEQDVANMLWAYATMGRVPGAGVMKELEGRVDAVAGTFNAQDVANTLRAACVFSTLDAFLRGRKSMGAQGCAATGVHGQARVFL